MARVSRKIKQTEYEKVQTISGPAAAYVRLSVLDNGQDTDESIINQKTMLTEFIKLCIDLQLVQCYVDNGKTGTDFERSGWRNLMDDIRQEKIKCIVVKDLSRLGRNYIEAGEYVEKIFPRFGVRLIAINDRYDSENILFQGNGLELSLRNLINDLYSKDISKKVKSSFESKKNSGEYIGSCAPYGYILSDNHLYPDESVKAIVKRIFQLKIKGIPNHKIASILNAESIPCPSKYKCECKEKRYRKYTDALWQSQAIGRILRNEVYIGNTVYKHDCSIYSQKPRKLPTQQWQRIENTHEPLVSRQIFEQVSAMLV